MVGLRKGDYERRRALKSFIGPQRIPHHYDSNLGICDSKMGVLTIRPCGSFYNLRSLNFEFFIFYGGGFGRSSDCFLLQFTGRAFMDN